LLAHLWQERLQADIVTRDTHEGEEFTMTVGEQVFSGKGAREEAAKAGPRRAVPRRDDHPLREHAAFKGFEILSRGQPAAPVPDLFIRGTGNLQRAPCRC
jgi:hypothetical protein